MEKIVLKSIEKYAFTQLAEEQMKIMSQIAPLQNKLDSIQKNFQVMVRDVFEIRSVDADKAHDITLSDGNGVVNFEMRKDPLPNKVTDGFEDGDIQ